MFYYLLDGQTTKKKWRTKLMNKKHKFWMTGLKRTRNLMLTRLTERKWSMKNKNHEQIEVQGWGARNLNWHMNEFETQKNKIIGSRCSNGIFLTFCWNGSSTALQLSCSEMMLILICILLFCFDSNVCINIPIVLLWFQCAYIYSIIILTCIYL